MRFDWRYFLDETRLDAGRLDALVPDLRRTTTQFARATGGTTDPERVALRSGLIALLERYEAERAASEAVLSVAATGPILLAAGAFAMTAVLLVARRRANLVLARERGASGGLLLGAELWEAVVLAGIGALAGYGLALALVPGRGSPLSPVLALATGVGAVLVLLAATWPIARRQQPRTARDEPPGLRTSPRRIVLEATAVGLAIAGIVLLQQRGLTIGATDGDQIVRFDPFLAAVPILAGVAAAIIAIRLYPLPIRAFGWLAARRRDLVPVLGLRSVARRGSFSTLPLLVLMLTAAFGSFAAVLMASIDQGQYDASWAGVGADYRVEARDGGNVAGLALLGTDGIEATAPAFLDTSAVFEDRPNHPDEIRLLAVDPAAYQAVTAGSPADPDWPAALLLSGTSDTPSLGTPDEPIPAIVSAMAPVGNQPLARGSVFPITGRGPGRDPGGHRGPSIVPGHPCRDAIRRHVLDRAAGSARATASAQRPVRPRRSGRGRRDLGGGRRSRRLERRRLAARLVRGPPRGAVDRGRRRRVPRGTRGRRGVHAARRRCRACPVVVASNQGHGVPPDAGIEQPPVARRHDPGARDAGPGCARSRHPDRDRRGGAARIESRSRRVRRPRGSVPDPRRLGGDRARRRDRSSSSSPSPSPSARGSRGARRRPRRCAQGRPESVTDRDDYGKPEIIDLPVRPARMTRVGSDEPVVRDEPISPHRPGQRAPIPAGPLIQCDGVVKIFKVADLEVVALQGLDLTVEPGEFIAIVGASGSGKSTLLSILGGLDVPSAGRVIVAGHRVGEMGSAERTRYRRQVLGFVWQQTARNLLPYLSARENVELPMLLEGVPRGDRTARTAWLLDLVGLADRGDHRPDQLSGGEQQRVAIAVALANEPALLLADEPTGELDTTPRTTCSSCSAPSTACWGSRSWSSPTTRSSASR